MIGTVAFPTETSRSVLFAFLTAGRRLGWELGCPGKRSFPTGPEDFQELTFRVALESFREPLWRKVRSFFRRGRMYEGTIEVRTRLAKISAILSVPITPVSRITLLEMRDVTRKMRDTSSCELTVLVSTEDRSQHLIYAPTCEALPLIVQQRVSVLLQEISGILNPKEGCG